MGPQMEKLEKVYQKAHTKYQITLNSIVSILLLDKVRLRM